MDKLPLAVRHLTLSDFRCFERAVVEPGPGLNVFTGPNGAGKTNLLEAVSFLSPGRGLRRARLRDVTRTGAAGGWAAASRIATNFGELKIGTGIEPAANGTQAAETARRSSPTARGSENYRLDLGVFRRQSGLLLRPTRAGWSPVWA